MDRETRPYMSAPISRGIEENAGQLANPPKDTPPLIQAVKLQAALNERLHEVVNTLATRLDPYMAAAMLPSDPHPDREDRAGHSVPVVADMLKNAHETELVIEFLMIIHRRLAL